MRPQILFIEEARERAAELALELRGRGYRVRLAASMVEAPDAERAEDPPRATRLRAGDIEMDLIARRVMRGDAEIALTPRAFALLEYFLRRPGQIVTRAMLLSEVWRYRFIPQTNVVDVHIGALRRKMDVPGRPSLIANIRGSGFILDAKA